MRICIRVTSIKIITYIFIFLMQISTNSCAAHSLSTSYENGDRVLPAQHKQQASVFAHAKDCNSMGFSSQGNATDVTPASRSFVCKNERKIAKRFSINFLFPHYRIPLFIMGLFTVYRCWLIFYTPLTRSAGSRRVAKKIAHDSSSSSRSRKKDTN